MRIWTAQGCHCRVVDVGETHKGSPPKGGQEKTRIIGLAGPPRVFALYGTEYDAPTRSAQLHPS